MQEENGDRQEGEMEIDLLAVPPSGLVLSRTESVYLLYLQGTWTVI